jgi:hypothetical protein
MQLYHLLSRLSKIEIVYAIAKGRISTQVVRLGKYQPPYIAEPTYEIMTLHCQPRSFLQVHHCLTPLIYKISQR